MTLNGHFMLNSFFVKFKFKIIYYYGQRHGESHMYACWKFVLNLLNILRRVRIFKSFGLYHKVKITCFRDAGLLPKCTVQLSS